MLAAVCATHGVLAFHKDSTKYLSDILVKHGPRPECGWQKICDTDDLRRFRDDLTALLGDGDELGGVTEMHIHPSPAPRYKVGDKVRWHLRYLTQPYPEIRIVGDVRAELSYRLNGGKTWVPESELEPVADKCAPDGTRCDSWRANQGTLSYSRNYCPDCGGRLR